MKKALALALILTLIAGCAPKAQSKELRAAEFFAMDTFMQVRALADEDTIAGCEELIRNVEKKLSVTDSRSEIFALNAGDHSALSGESLSLLRRALELCRRTDGALDITVYPAVRAWGFTTGEYRVPGDEELEGLARLVDHRSVRLSDGGASIPEGAMIDLGSVAKGYAGDRALDLLKQKGVKSALLNLGGNVQTLGARPDGSPWRVAVRDPSGEGVLGAVSVEGAAVITSGGYERYFEKDGKIYWHIIDPFTCRPADSGLVSVTVIGKSGLVCDGLSTALFVMGLERASGLWRSSDDFEAVFVTTGGEIYITRGLEGNFTPMGEWQDSRVTVIR